VDSDALEANDSAMTTHTSPDHTQSDGQTSPAGPLHRWVLPIRAPNPVNPVLVKHAEQRAEYEQNRIAGLVAAPPLALTEQVHDAAGAGGPGSHGSEPTPQDPKEDDA
jgi:hypothetical protein